MSGLSNLFLDDNQLERYLSGQTSFRISFLVDDGILRWQPSNDYLPPGLYQEGQYDGVTPNPNTVLYQANIDSFLGEPGVIDEQSFQNMPDDLSTYGVLFRFKFPIDAFFYASVWRHNRSIDISQTIGGNFNSSFVGNGLRWVVQPLTAGGFAFAATVKENNLLANYRDQDVYTFTFYCRLK